MTIAGDPSLTTKISATRCDNPGPDEAPSTRIWNTHTRRQRWMLPLNHSDGPAKWAIGVTSLTELTRGRPPRTLRRSNKRACSTPRLGVVPGHRAGGAGVGRTRPPTAHGPGVPSGLGHFADTGSGAVLCVQPGLAGRRRGRRARAGRRLCRAASAPAWSRHWPPRQAGAPGPDSPSSLLTAFGDLSCIVFSCIGWSASRANSH